MYLELNILGDRICRSSYNMCNLGRVLYNLGDKVRHLAPIRSLTNDFNFYPRARRALRVYFVLVLVLVVRIAVSQIKAF
jgi:hypothetical protein